MTHEPKIYIQACDVISYKAIYLSIPFKNQCLYICNKFLKQKENPNREEKRTVVVLQERIHDTF